MITEDRIRKWELLEFGRWTRRRPIGRGYAAAKDAEVGIVLHNRATSGLEGEHSANENQKMKLEYLGKNQFCM